MIVVEIAEFFGIRVRGEHIGKRVVDRLGDGAVPVVGGQRSAAAGDPVLLLGGVPLNRFDLRVDPVEVLVVPVIVLPGPEDVPERASQVYAVDLRRPPSRGRRSAGRGAAEMA